MKKFFIGTLTALMLLSFGALTEASQAEYENLCYRGNYCYSQNGDNYDGECCDRYGCGQGYGCRR